LIYTLGSLYPLSSVSTKILKKGCACVSYCEFVEFLQTIYHGALEASCEIAQKEGPYETYEGSPMSKGMLQQDFWGAAATDLWNWEKLRFDLFSIYCSKCEISHI
jgi:hypothetical protein